MILVLEGHNGSKMTKYAPKGHRICWWCRCLSSWTGDVKTVASVAQYYWIEAHRLYRWAYNAQILYWFPLHLRTWLFAYLCGGLGEPTVPIEWLRFQCEHLWVPNLCEFVILRLRRAPMRSSLVVLKLMTSFSVLLVGLWLHSSHFGSLASSNFRCADQLSSIQNISPLALT